MLQWKGDHMLYNSGSRKDIPPKNKLLKDRGKIILNQNVCTAWLCRHVTSYQTGRLPKPTARLRAEDVRHQLLSQQSSQGVHQPVGVFFTPKKLLFLHPIYTNEI